MATELPEDYYELLQLSPTAEPATILAVYRLLSAKYDPANKTTGDSRRFTLMKRAYETLSNKEKRLAYDAQRRSAAAAGMVASAPPAVATANGGAPKPEDQSSAPAAPTPAPMPVVANGDSAANRRFEAHKRRAIMNLLYDWIIANPLSPGLNMRQMEDKIGIPKEKLEFAIWYLNESGMVRAMDNGRFAITQPGVAACEAADAQPAPASGPAAA